MTEPNDFESARHFLNKAIPKRDDYIQLAIAHALVDIAESLRIIHNDLDNIDSSVASS